MAIHDLTSGNLPFHLNCLQSLAEDTDRHWGEMSPLRMIHHLRVAIELSLDDSEEKIKPIVPPGLRTLVGWVFFDLMTKWPRGRLKALPQFIPEPAEEFDPEKRLLADAMETFTKRCEKDPEEEHVHPVMGAITLRRTAHAHGVHMNHHYRQFGLLPE